MVTFIEAILNGKLQFCAQICSESFRKNLWSKVFRRLPLEEIIFSKITEESLKKAVYIRISFLDFLPSEYVAKILGTSRTYIASQNLKN